MKKTTRRLALNKQIIARLSADKLDYARGGGDPSDSTIIIIASYPCTAYQCPSLIATDCRCA